MLRALLIAALLIASPLLAQTSGDLSAPVTHLGSATVSATASQTPAQAAPLETQPGTDTPVIHLGSATVSATVPQTPVEAVPVETIDDRDNIARLDARLVSPSLLAASRFERVDSPTNPTAITRGNMADTSISLGEYARKLRAQQKRADDKATTHPAKRR